MNIGKSQIQALFFPDLKCGACRAKRVKNSGFIAVVPATANKDPMGPVHYRVRSDCVRPRHREVRETITRAVGAAFSR